MDPSLNNWGLAKGIYDTETNKLDITGLYVIDYKPTKSKQVRQNSKDLDVAQHIATIVESYCFSADHIFAEMPIGSQSARAMASYGICVGIMGTLCNQGNGRSFTQVTPTEVKLAGFGTKTATKKEMISWGLETHPEAPWPMKTVKGVQSAVTGTAEHMADAVAAIHAGMKLPEFQYHLKALNRYEV